MSLQSVVATPPAFAGMGGDHDEIRDTWIGVKERSESGAGKMTTNDPTSVTLAQEGSDDDTDEYEYTQSFEQKDNSVPANDIVPVPETTFHSAAEHAEGASLQRDDTLPVADAENEAQLSESPPEEEVPRSRKRRHTRSQKSRGKQRRKRRQRSGDDYDVQGDILNESGTGSRVERVDGSQDLNSSQESIQEEGNMMRKQEEGVTLEDGELEDGEIDDEDTSAVTQVTEVKVKQETHLEDGNAGTEAPPGDDEAGDSSDSEEDEEQMRKERKRRRKDKKRKRREEKEKKRKKVKRPKYIDHDQQNDYPAEMCGAWGGYPGKRSPPAPYDTPSVESPVRPYSSPARAKDHHRERSPPGPYDSPYESPPGPYDSPSDEDDYDQPNKQKRLDLAAGSENREKRSMLSMVDDDYMDVNIAANEKQDMFQRTKMQPGQQRGQLTAGQLKKIEKSKRFLSKQRQRTEQMNEPKPKLLCKFFKEGNCAKGVNCGFSHDFKPPRKLEVCKFYITDSCAKGEHCLYMHKDYPCKYFHTNHKCYQGENCKFSHEPLDEDTSIIVEKMWRGEDYNFHNSQIDNQNHEEASASPGKRPSLLGSPPRLDKKIPSLFDIKVSPPTHIKPQQPASQPPPAQHPRPAFYGEIGGSPSRPGPPPRMMGARPQGPPPHGPPPHRGPPLLANPRIPPPGHLNRPQMPRPNLGSFPPGPGMGLRPGGPPPGMGPQQNNRPHLQASRGPPDMGHQDSLLGPPPTDLNPMTGNFRPPASQGSFESGPGSETEEKTELADAGLESAASLGSESESERKQGNFDFPAHLAPKQRELFMRIQQQQREAQEIDSNPADEDKDNAEDDNWYSSDEEDQGSGQAGGSGQSENLTNLFKSLSQQQKQQQQQGMGPSAPPGQPTPPAGLTTSSSSSASFNIVDMISAIKNQNKPGPAQNGPPAMGMNMSRDPRQQQGQGQVDPRSSGMLSQLPGGPGLSDPRRPPVSVNDPRFQPGANGGVSQIRGPAPNDPRGLPPNDPRASNNQRGFAPKDPRGSASSDPRRQQQTSVNDPRLQQSGGSNTWPQQNSNTSGGMTPPTNSNDPRRLHQSSSDPRMQQKNPSDPRLLPPLPPLELSSKKQHEPVEINASSGGPFPYNLRPFVCEQNHKPALPNYINLNNPRFKNDPRLQKHFQSAKSHQGSGDCQNTGPADPRMPRNNSADTLLGSQDPRLLRGSSNPGTQNISDPRVSMNKSDSASSLSQSGGVTNASYQRQNSAPANLPPLLTSASSKSSKQSSELSPIQSPEPSNSFSSSTSMPSLLATHPSLPPLLASRPPSMDRAKTTAVAHSDPRLSRQSSTTGQVVTDTISDGENKPLLSHRSDPRFKKKAKVEVNIPLDAPVGNNQNSARLSGRRDNLEYSSPLGGSDSQSEGVSGYNSGYNQHSHLNKASDNSSNKSFPGRFANAKSRQNGSSRGGDNKQEGSGIMETVLGGAEGRGSPSVNESHYAHSLQSMPQPTLPDMTNNAMQQSLPNSMNNEEVPASLKDVFKTFDPTASPFC